MSILTFGDSHLDAIRGGYEEISSKEELPFCLDFMRLHPTSNPDELIDRAKNDERIDSLAWCVGGNAYFVHGALNHPRRFDFVLPESPNLPLAEDVEVIPYDLVRSRFLGDLRAAMTFMDEVRAHIDLPLYQISTPPVVDSLSIARQINETAKRAPNQSAQERQRDLEILGIAPPALRYKLWCVHVSVMREWGLQYAISFIEAPGISADSAGLLREEYRSDAIHANSSYGQLVVRQLMDCRSSLRVREDSR